MKLNCQERDSSIELLRIIAMLLVLMVHASFKALDAPTMEDVLNSPISSFLRFLSESISIICVNVFILITGWFSIRPKVSRFCGLVFQVLFIAVFIYLCLLLLEEIEPWGVLDWIRLLLLRRELWFVSAYLVLYIISPILNAFVSSADRKTFKYVLLTFFVIQTIYGTSSKWSFFCSGYSPLSFVGLYLLARYMRIYHCRFCTLPKWYDISIYLCSTILITIMSMISVGYAGYDGWLFYEYSSPMVIISSVCFFLFFTKLSFQNKAVNWVASSAFAVYLFHCDPSLFYPYYLLPIKSFYNNDPFFLFLLHTSSLIIVVFIMAILVDKIRAFFWNKILFYYNYFFCNSN